MRWYRVEPEKRKFLWADAEVRMAVEHKLEILGCIHGWAEWALKDAPADGASQPPGEAQDGRNLGPLHNKHQWGQGLVVAAAAGGEAAPGGQGGASRL